MREVMVAASLLRDEEGTPCGTVGIIKNITELKAAQRNLTHSERLSTIGKILSGVAHELNNPLCGVLGFSQLLMARHSDGPQSRREASSPPCTRCGFWPRMSGRLTGRGRRHELIGHEGLGLPLVRQSFNAAEVAPRWRPFLVAVSWHISLRPPSSD